VLVSEPRTSLDYSVLVSLKRTPNLTLALAHDPEPAADDADPPQIREETIATPLSSALELTPPPALRGPGADVQTRRTTTLYALLATSGYVYNRRRSDIRLSRIPEVGISLTNLSGARDAAPSSPSDIPALGQRGWLINADAALGSLSERPTGASAVRAGLRVDGASPLGRLLGPVYSRVGFTVWGNLYNGGRSYLLAAPEAEIDLFLGPNRLLGAAYRREIDYGRTPFLFDRMDVRNDLALRYAVLGPKWVYDLNVRYDLDRGRAYDTLASIRRRTDCIEVGVAYSARSQGLSLILNLLPAPRQEPGPGPR
jgi:hypothetical protein